MMLFVFIALFYGALQIHVLTTPARTINWRTVILAFFVGTAACGTLALLAEYAIAASLYPALHLTMIEAARIGRYTQDPFIEETIKVLPIAAVLFFPNIRKELRHTDIVIIAAALGAGFGLFENVLSLGYSADKATWSDGFWQISGGFGGSVAIPGPWVTLWSWLPAGISKVGMFADPEVSLNNHLIWSALTGLGLALAFKPGKARWAAVFLWLFAGLDHAAANASLSSVRLPLLLSPLLDGLRGHAFYLYVPVTLAFSLWLDRLRIQDAATRTWKHISAGNNFGVWSAATILSVGAAVFRDALQYIFRTAKSIASLRTSKDGAETNISSLPQSQKPDTGAKNTTKSRTSVGIVRRVWFLYSIILSIFPVLYFVIGDFPFTKGLQAVLASQFAFDVSRTVLLGAIVIQFICVVVNSTKRARKSSSAQSAVDRVNIQLASILGIGSIGISIVSLVWCGSLGPLATMSPTHAIEHWFQSNALNTTMLGLALAAISSWLNAAFSRLFAVTEVSKLGASINAHGYIPSAGDAGLLARAIFSEGASTPEDMKALGWAIVNRVGDKQFGQTLDGVLHQHNAYQFLPEGGGPAGGSQLWHASASPEKLTGANAISWAKAKNDAESILSGTMDDPTGGATYFFASKTYDPNDANTAPAGFFRGALQDNRLYPSTYQNEGSSNHFFVLNPPSEWLSNRRVQ